MVGHSRAASMRAAAHAELFKALAHPARARVLGVLVSGSASVPDLCTATGLKPSHLAGHLTLLRAQHLVVGTRSGGRLLYALSVPEIALVLAAADSVLSARSAAEIRGFTGSTDAPSSGHGMGEDGIGALLEELVPLLEQSLRTRALIAKAVESVSSRTGQSAEAVQGALLAEAVERGLTFAEAATDAASGKGRD